MKQTPSTTSKILNLRKYMCYKIKVQRRNLNFDISIEHPHENEDLIQKNVLPGVLGDKVVATVLAFTVRRCDICNY